MDNHLGQNQPIDYVGSVGIVCATRIVQQDKSRCTLHEVSLPLLRITRVLHQWQMSHPKPFRPLRRRPLHLEGRSTGFRSRHDLFPIVDRQDPSSGLTVVNDGRHNSREVDYSEFPLNSSPARSRGGLDVEPRDPDSILVGYEGTRRTEVRFLKEL